MATPMTLADFRLRYPEFAAVPDEQVQVQLDDATLLLNEDRWCELYAQGQGLLAAHELALSAAYAGGGAASGIADDVTSETAGNVSYSRSAATIDAIRENPYNATRYGQKYLSLVRQVGAGAIAV